MAEQADCPARSPNSSRSRETWCLATETERWNKRLRQHRCRSCGSSTTRSFPGWRKRSNTATSSPLDDLPEDALNLLHLVYSLIMVAMAVEIMHQTRPVDAADAVMIRTGEPVP